jgi:hypothetical protein
MEEFMSKFIGTIAMLTLGTAFGTLALVAPLAMAGDSAAKATYQDIEQTLGSVPGMFRVFPQVGIAGAWDRVRVGPAQL